MSRLNICYKYFLGLTIFVRYFISPKLFVPISKIENDEFKFKFNKETKTPNSLL